MHTRHKYVRAHFEINVDAHAHIFASCAWVCAQIFTNIFLVFHYSVISLIFKFHKDLISVSEIFAKYWAVLFFWPLLYTLGRSSCPVMDTFEILYILHINHYRNSEMLRLNVLERLENLMPLKNLSEYQNVFVSTAQPTPWINFWKVWTVFEENCFKQFALSK